MKSVVIGAAMLASIVTSGSVRAQVPEEETTFVTTVLTYRAAVERGHQTTLGMEAQTEEFIKTLRPYFHQPVRRWLGVIEDAGRDAAGNAIVMIRVISPKVHLINYSTGIKPGDAAFTVAKEVLRGAPVCFSGRILQFGAGVNSDFDGDFDFAIDTLTESNGTDCPSG